MSELDLNVALARETPDLLNVAFLLIGPVTLFDLRETTIQIISLSESSLPPPSSLLPPLRVSPATLQYDRCEKNEEEQQSKKADKNYHQYEVKVLFAGIFWCRRSGVSGNCHPHSNQGNIGFLIQISCVARL